MDVGSLFFFPSFSSMCVSDVVVCLVFLLRFSLEE